MKALHRIAMAMLRTCCRPLRMRRIFQTGSSGLLSPIQLGVAWMAWLGRWPRNFQKSGSSRSSSTTDQAPARRLVANMSLVPRPTATHCC